MQFDFKCTFGSQGYVVLPIQARDQSTAVVKCAHWRGAHVADVLDELHNSDANLSVIEPFFETYETEIKDRTLTAMAVYACYYTHDRAATWERVSELLSRV